MTFATPKAAWPRLQDALRDPDISVEGLRVVVAAADALLGLRLADLDPAEVDQRRTAADLAPEEVAAIERLIAERTQARKEKNWARADEIRTELDALGVQVTDTPTGPTWQLSHPSNTGEHAPAPVTQSRAGHQPCARPG